MSSKRTKGQISGNINIRGKDSTLPMNQTQVSANRYAALEAYSETHRNDIETNTSTENELTYSYIRSKPNSNVNNVGNYNTTIKEHRAVSSNQPKSQHNLQNPKKNQKDKRMDEDKLRFSIPTVINDQTIRKEKGKSTTPTKVFQETNKRNAVNVHSRASFKPLGCYLRQRRGHNYECRW
jgi:hypothetical protein